ncbi:MAG: sulfite exporter TauE/SafE family protein [Gammaproteobacteria bacterium]|nr:sulfite exporter TauE/SafE family protein [Gammaproteobacteria bacterium]
MISELLQLTPLQIFLSILIIFIAYVVKGLSGFGSGLVAIPLLAFLFPLKLIVPVLGLLSYSGTIMQSLQLRKQVVWRDLFPLIPFSVAGISIATWLLVNIEAHLLALALGIFVLSYSIYSLLAFNISAGSRHWAILAGSFGGLVGALFGTGGPFYVVYFKMRQLDKGAFRATIAMVFLIDGGTRMLTYASAGLFTQQVITLIVLLFPVLVIAMYVGNHLHIKINQHRFNQVISIMLFFSGIMLIYKAVNFG